jgi:hypothetical protein
MTNIDIYYESLKQVYNQILEWRKRPEPFRDRLSSWLIGIAAVVFFLSLIPILPTIFVFVGSRMGWTIGSFNLSQATILTYGLAWLIAGVGTLVILIVAIPVSGKLSTSIKDKKPPQTLSPEQMTFIAVYEAYKELKIYFVSHIDQHVNNCLRSLEKIQIYASDRVDIEERLQRRRLNPAEVDMIYLAEPVSIRTLRVRSSLPRQISIAQEFLQIFEKYTWFNLDDVTKSRLQALISFQKKTLVRLQKREDLPAVLKILENLSKFTYAYLPEHQTNMDPETLEQLQVEGSKCLGSFVQEVEKLTDFPEEPCSISSKETERQTQWQKLQAFYFYNVFFRFTLWFILLLGLTSGLVFLAGLRIQQLDINVMVSMVIATSITGSAALAVFGGRSAELRQNSESNIGEISSNASKQNQ